MAISRYGMPNSGSPLGRSAVPPGKTMTALGPVPIPKAPVGGQPVLPQAMPPAGLPPDAYATLKSPLKRAKTKAGPLTSLTQPRRVTPSDTNQSKMLGQLGETQVGAQLTPDAVMGMDNDKWTKLLAEFGVFA